MRAIKSFTLFLLLFLSIFHSQNSFAKSNWKLQVDGRVLWYDVSQVKNVNANPCKVSLYKDSVLLQELVNPANSEFSFLLDPDHDYVVCAQSEGYIKQQVLISTKEVPDQRGARPFTTLRLNLIIFKTFPGYDYSFLEKPLVRICYSYTLDGFDYDPAYETSMAASNRKMEGLSAIAMKHDSYDFEIQRGDKLFADGDWDKAKSAYLGASANLPLEKYPKEQIAKCDVKLNEIKAAEEAKDKKYADLLAQADAKFEAKDYAAAKSLYEQAALVRPELVYPKVRIEECDNGPANDKKYADLIAVADKLFADKDYDGARVKYEQASQIKPNEKYPIDQIKKCDDGPYSVNKYNQAIARAEAQFKAKNYSAAKAAYQEASALQPDQQYPKAQIAKCDEAINGPIDNKQYDKWIAEADAAFKVKDYVNAKQTYQQASNLKPEQQYPKDQIQKCNVFIGEGSPSKVYNDLISKADAQFTAKDWAGAKQTYQQASAQKPTEQYPQDKIKKCDEMLAKGFSAEKKINELYPKTLHIADSLFSAKKWEEAKSNYTMALALKPNEQYPKDQLAMCDSKLKEESDPTTQNQYNEAISIANNLFSAKDWAEAKSYYKQAADLKPNEQYPKDRIKACDEQLAKTDYVNPGFMDAIAAGDTKFKAGDWAGAKAEYQKALAIMPTEQYPKDQIALCDKNLAEGNRPK